MHFPTQERVPGRSFENSPGQRPTACQIPHYFPACLFFHCLIVPRASGPRDPRPQSDHLSYGLGTTRRPLGAPWPDFCRFLAAPPAIKKSAAPGRGWLGVVRLRSQYQGQIPEDSPPPPSADHPGRRKIRKQMPGRIFRSQNTGFFRIFTDLKSIHKFIKKHGAKKTSKIENIWAQTAKITGFY